MSATMISVTGNSASGEPIKIVSPSAQKNVEGDSSVQPAATPNKIQFLFPAADFAGLPANQRWLVAFNGRGDQTQTQTVDWIYPDIDIWMSTTNKTSATLSTVFADNHGPNKTHVHDGQYALRILGSGSPRDFAPGMRFQTPFYYDPSQGNLLIEQIHHTPTTPNPSPRSDVQSTPGFTIVAGGFNTQATVGTLFTGLPVYQFEFAVPEPSAVALTNVMFVNLLALRRRRRSLVRCVT
jgi:hypothetical protein